MKLLGGTLSNGNAMRRVEEIENLGVLISETEWDGDSVYHEVQSTAKDSQKIIKVQEHDEQSVCATDSLLPVKGVEGVFRVGV